MPEFLMAPKKPRRHRLTKMVYDEISFVDRGANQHANVMIVKREGVAKQRPAEGGSSSKGGGERKAGWYAADRAPTKSGSGKGAKSERAQNWKEDRHKRKAAGSPSGGEFDKTSGDSKKKYGKGGTTKAKQDAAKKGAKSYTVKKGDTLWALAEKYYGDGTKWKLIAKANKIKDPRKLQIGTKLVIPGVTDKKKTAKKKASSSASPGEHRVMEPGGRVHWEKDKAVRQKSTTKTTKTKAEIAAQKRAAAKAKADRLRRQREARKKVLVKKRVTEVDMIAARNMFHEYTGRR